MSTEATPAPAAPAVHPSGSAPSTVTDPTDGAPPMPVPPAAPFELFDPDSVIDDEPEDPGAEDADAEAARERRDSLVSVADQALATARESGEALQRVGMEVHAKTGRMPLADPGGFAELSGAASLARIADALEAILLQYREEVDLDRTKSAARDRRLAQLVALQGELGAKIERPLPPEELAARMAAGFDGHRAKRWAERPAEQDDAAAGDPS